MTATPSPDRPASGAQPPSLPQLGRGIRPARASDAAEILAMVRELAVFEKLLHTVVADEAAIIRHCLTPGSVAQAIIAEEGDAVVGYAMWFATFSSFLGRPGIHLEDVYVRPARRRQGIGRRLLLSVAAVARAQGSGRLEWSALHWNEPALAFYRSLSAVVLDEWVMLRLDGAALADCPGP